jgi:predicted DCC family thiol-disulfide oxidoreductase YuxK
VYMDDFVSLENFLRKPPSQSYGSDAITSSEFFQSVVTSNKPVLLSAPGGSGKTHFLIDVVYRAMERGRAPFWLDLSKLDDKKANAQPLTSERIIELTSASGGIDQFRTTGNNAFVVVDGLNEFGEFREKIASVLADLRRTGGVPVILGDRLGPRASRDYFKLSTLSPLSLDQIRKSIGPALREEDTWKRLLSSPFFLSLYLKVRGDDISNALTRNEMFRRYFAVHVFSGSPDSWKPARISKPAYEFYRCIESRAAARAKWLEVGFEESDLTILQQSGALLKGSNPEDIIEFQHQLLHDWLAANHVAALPKDGWTNETFEAVTLRRGSFESISFTAEQLSSDRVTEFLVCAYDWNWLGVLQVILNFEQRQHGGVSPVGREFRDALFSLNALRQFDLFEHTQDAVRVSLKHYSDLVDALPIDNRRNTDEVLEAYRTRYGTGPLESPFDTFRDTLLNTSIADAKAVEKLATGPFLGWTAANMIRLVEMTSDYVAQAIFLFKTLRTVAPKVQESVGVRWRIVHTLGRAKQGSNLTEFIQGVLFDAEESPLVRLGAARSFMERAALEESPNERHAAICKLIDRMNAIDSSVARSELRKATIIGNYNAVPAGWYDDVEPLVQKGLEMARAAHAGDVEQWERRLKDVETKRQSLNPARGA